MHSKPTYETVKFFELAEEIFSGALWNSNRFSIVHANKDNKLSGTLWLLSFMQFTRIASRRSQYRHKLFNKLVNKSFVAAEIETLFDSSRRKAADNCHL